VGFRLASILGKENWLRFQRGGKRKLAAVEPGDRGALVGESGVDEYWVVGADAELDGEGGVGDVERAGAVEEVAPDAVGGGVLAAGELAGE
jgi:hypothetical protein